MGEVGLQFWINSYVTMLILAWNFPKWAKVGLAQDFSDILAYKLAYCCPPSETWYILSKLINQHYRIGEN